MQRRETSHRLRSAERTLQVLFRHLEALELAAATPTFVNLSTELVRVAELSADLKVQVDSIKSSVDDLAARIHQFVKI